MHALSFKIDSRRKRPVQFTFVADAVLSVKLHPDHDQARITFRIANLDALETATAEFPAHAVTTGLLDELARWITGEPSQFLKLAENARRIEA